MHNRLVRQLIAFGTLLVTASPSRADTQIGADLDYARPINSDVDSGGGFAARLGWQLHVPLLVLTPEGVFNYVRFSGSGGPSVYRGLGGVRLGLGEVLRPGVFGHAGVAQRSADFTFDVGAFLDFTLLPLLNVGVHVAYNRIRGGDDPSFQWLTLGAHAELIF